MTNVVKLKRGSGSDPSASDMVVGEPVIRTDTAELFFKKDDGTVAKVSGGGGGPDFKYLALRNSANNGAASYPAADFTLVTDGTTTAVTPAAAATLLVSYAGVIQRPSTGTSTPANGFALSGSTIKFAANIAAAPDFIIYQESGGIGEPSDNTVTTAKIVDDAVTADKLANSINSEIAANTAKVTNATHSGEVTGATALTIADNVVDEANLKVDNSPTNDYVLTAKSSAAGGLTWAAVSTTDSTKMPLAGGTFTGDVIWDSQTNAGRDMTWDESESDLTFNDAAYIQMGNSNDLTIGHNGTYSFITQTGSKLTIGSGGNHAVELLYGNAKKLETNSEGVVIRGGEDSHGVIYLYADEGDDNADMWTLQAKKTASTFTIQNNNAGAWDNSLKCHGDGAVELYYDNSKKLETTSTGATISGLLAVSGSTSQTSTFTGNGLSVIHSSGSNMFIGTQSGTDGKIAVTNNADLHFRTNNTERLRITAAGDINIPVDGDKLQLGASQDLQLYHDGTDSTILNDEGILELRCNDIRLMNNAGNEHYVVGFANSYSALYYDNSKKIETTSTGILVNDTVIKQQKSGEVSVQIGSTNAGGAAIYFDGDSNGDFVGGDYSWIRHTTSGNMELCADNPAANAGFYLKTKDGATNSIYCQGGGKVELMHNGSSKFETTSDGAEVKHTSGSAILKVTGSEGNAGAIWLAADDNDDYTDTVRLHQSSDGRLYIQNNTASSTWENMITAGANGSVELYYDNSKKFETKSYGANMPDDSQLYFGTDDDLVIKHDGTDSRIINAGSDLYVYTTGDHEVKILADSQNAVICKPDAAVELYYDNSKKFETNNEGVEITGKMTFDSSVSGRTIKLEDDQKLFFGGGDDLKIFHDGYNRICGDHLYINNILNSETGIYYGVNSKVGLYFDGAEKFFTTSTGCEVSGYLNVTNTGLTAQIYHSGSGDTIGCVMRHGRGGLSGYAGKMIGFYGNDNTEEGSIVIGTAATAYNESSDYRLKENEIAISDGITRLKKLKPYRFNWKKDPDVTVDGFFAHEITPAVPEAVHGDKDATNSDGSVKPQQIDKSKLVPLLTAALQEAIGKIEVLETKVAALEAS